MFYYTYPVKELIVSSIGLCDIEMFICVAWTDFVIVIQLNLPFLYNPFNTPNAYKGVELI